MEIRRYESDLLKSNMYLIVEGSRCIAVDPCRRLDVIGDLTVDRILLTHEHYDHISGVNLWKEATGAPVLCSRACSENIRNARKNLSSLFEVFCEIQTWIKLDRIPDADRTYTCTAEETFEDTFEFQWCGHAFRLFEIPGHSMGSIGILVDDACFFSGDSLLENTETETGLPGGSRKKWNDVGRPRVEALPGGITVYPGHIREFALEER